MRYVAHNYQQTAFDHILNTDFCGLFMDMGLGKTVVTLTALNRLIYQEAEISRVLIVAPKRVTRFVWKQEAQKWDHLKHLKISVVWGSVSERKAALKEKADIFVINRENLVWLVNLFQGAWPFSTVVLDELSSYKNHATHRFKAMRMIRPRLKRLIGLTGTPAPNSLMDLWAPLYLLDEGQRLEKNITGYRERYFTLKNPKEMYAGYKLRKEAEQAIYNKIGDICISMKASDYLDLPPIIDNDLHLFMDDNTMNQYDEFERDSVMEIFKPNEDGVVEITAMSAVALRIKLLQFANGAIYHDGKNWIEVHTIKLDALAEIIEDSFGQPVMVFYSYRHDKERIMKRFPQTRELHSEKDLDDWNAGNIPILILHPASAGHGLNMQQGGNIMVWFGLNDSAELYQQAVARLMRQGQTRPLMLHRLIMENTMDIAVVENLSNKVKGQDALMAATKAIVEKHLSANRGILLPPPGTLAGITIE